MIAISSEIAASVTIHFRKVVSVSLITSVSWIDNTTG